MPSWFEKKVKSISLMCGLHFSWKQILYLLEQSLCASLLPNEFLNYTISPPSPPLPPPTPMLLLLFLLFLLLLPQYLRCL